MSWFTRTATAGKAFIIVVLAFATLTLHPLPTFADHETDGGDDDRDQVVLSFSTVGDSRQDPKKFDPTTAPLSGQDKIWLQNTKAWSRIMRSIQAQKSDLLFFNGDMIMGYGKATTPLNAASVDGVIASDLMKFYRQYGFWRGMVADLMETGTYVVPVPGNHETQCNDSVSETKCGNVSGKHAMQENEDAWRQNMGDLIVDDTRFQNLFGEKPSYEATGDNRNATDGLTTDQTQLSYSFDFRGSHFVVINTDPVGKDAHAPVKWLADDLAAAQGRGAVHFFVFGHKPAYTYYYGAIAPLPASPSGLDNDVVSRDAFWDLIEQYGATYFCGHEHIFHLSQPRATQGGKAWQILVGSGGSPFEAAPTDTTVSPSTDRDYAWAKVKVFENGKVKITAYGFDDQYGKTRVIGSITLKN